MLAHPALSVAPLAKGEPLLLQAGRVGESTLRRGCAAAPRDRCLGHRNPLKRRKALHRLPALWAQDPPAAPWEDIHSHLEHRAWEGTGQSWARPSCVHWSHALLLSPSPGTHQLHSSGKHPFTPSRLALCPGGERGDGRGRRGTQPSPTGKVTSPQASPSVPQHRGLSASPWEGPASPRTLLTNTWKPRLVQGLGCEPTRSAPQTSHWTTRASKQQKVPRLHQLGEPREMGERGLRGAQGDGRVGAQRGPGRQVCGGSEGPQQGRGSGQCGGGCTSGLHTLPVWVPRGHSGLSLGPAQVPKGQRSQRSRLTFTVSKRSGSCL